MVRRRCGRIRRWAWRLQQEEPCAHDGAFVLPSSVSGLAELAYGCLTATRRCGWDGMGEVFSQQSRVAEQERRPINLLPDSKQGFGKAGGVHRPSRQRAPLPRPRRLAFPPHHTSRLPPRSITAPAGALVSALGSPYGASHWPSARDARHSTRGNTGRTRSVRGWNRPGPAALDRGSSIDKITSVALSARRRHKSCWECSGHRPYCLVAGILVPLGHHGEARACNSFTTLSAA